MANMDLQQRSDPKASPVLYLRGTPTSSTNTKSDSAAEKTLRTYLLAMESTVDGMAITDIKGNFTFMNRAHAEMFGYNNPDFLIGKSWQFLYDEEELKIWEGRVEKFLEEGRWAGEVHAKRKDGSIFAQEVTLTALPFGGAICVCRDVTKRKKNEAELQRLAEDLIRSNKELEHFAYVASHDLQEPLRMISSFVSLLSEELEGQLTESSEKYIQFVQDGVERMKTLIRDLLTYSRIEIKNTYEKPVDSEEVFRVVKQNLSKLIETSSTQINCSKLPILRVSASQLLQLFQNIIENAIKYRGQNTPEVQISAARSSKEWLFSIRDNGIGFKMSHHDRIFQIFQRLCSRNSMGGGSGIGLAIAKKIVEGWGGRIWADSEEGKGSTFYFTIPIQFEVEPSIRGVDS